ncbi:hypothetical protein B296_00046611, partial [Ensete ventricosum]
MAPISWSFLKVFLRVCESASVAPSHELFSLCFRLNRGLSNYYLSPRVGFKISGAGSFGKGWRSHFLLWMEVKIGAFRWCRIVGLTMIGAMELQLDDGPRSSLGIGLGSDEAVRPHREFARRFAKVIEKLVGNTPGDCRKNTGRLTVRIPDAAKLAG